MTSAHDEDAPSLMQRRMSPWALQGVTIVHSSLLDDRPKMQLTPKVYDNLPKQFADEMNAWMRDFFGVESQGVILTGGNTLFAGKEAFVNLQRASSLGAPA